MLGGSVGPRPALTKLSNYTNVPHIGSNLIIFLIPSPDGWQVHVDVPDKGAAAGSSAEHQHQPHTSTGTIRVPVGWPALHAPPELKYRWRKKILKTREGICTGWLPVRQVKTMPPENRQVVPEKLSVVPQKNAERSGTIHLFIILFFPLNSSSWNNTLQILKVWQYIV